MKARLKILDEGEVKDFRGRGESLPISNFSGKAYRVKSAIFEDMPEDTRKIGPYFEDIFNELIKVEFDLRISKNYANQTGSWKIFKKYKWSSWFMLSTKSMNQTVSGYIFLTVTEDCLYFIVFSKDGLKDLIQYKQIASNDRYHFYFGESRRWGW
ncbi:hypothetical protein D3X11_06230 [Streptococcus sp. X16XC17]|uniref:hypothetical protein n=1 Tax=unclassified Streptococcus TaxID=2608887 RepID=UPI00066FE6BC|nr:MULTISPECIES: hypothetical protein [unclassified Streptococcus]TCD45805.1 hypothetical protein D3X11_06230 [Streptococcus sp. X16XC17]